MREFLYILSYKNKKRKILTFFTKYGILSTETSKKRKSNAGTAYTCDGT